MHRAILTLLLALLSHSAAAQWVEVGDTGNATVYVDPATIRRAGSMVKMGTLYDLKTAVVSKTNGKRYLSQKMQTEYDCREARWRMLHFSWHSGNMGGGEMVESLSDSYKWEPVPPGSGVEILWQLACGRK